MTPYLSLLSIDQGGLNIGIYGGAVSFMAIMLKRLSEGAVIVVGHKLIDFRQQHVLIFD